MIGNVKDVTHYSSLWDRFYAQFEPITESGCWIWLGSCNKRGYGNIKDNYKTKRANRVSYELHIGPIKKGMVICHKCDIPECVNPAHLYQGTHKDNAKDRGIRGRNNSCIGEKHGSSKLTIEEVIFIRKSEFSCVKLARMFRVGRSTITAIRRYEKWRNVYAA